MVSRDADARRRISGTTWATPNVWWRNKGPADTQPWTVHGGRSGRDSKTTSEAAAAASFGDELVEFVSNISMHGYRWLVEPTFSAWENFIWLLVHVSATIAIVVILNLAYTRYTTTPMVTTLFDTVYPISLVPFPAISICNNNRISRLQAAQYAKRLVSSTNVTKVTPFPYDLRELGKLYDSDAFSDVDLLEFQHLLNQYDEDNTDDRFDAKTQMEKLSPQCEDMLLRCVWRGEERPCLAKEVMFEQRITQYGFCCTFNYVRTDTLSQEESKPYYIDETGSELGLILLLNGSSSDYYYPLYNFVGFIVQVFNPYEFPDVPSGSVSEKLVDLGYETFIRIDSSTLVTEDETRRYSAQTRGCLFADDFPEKFAGRYKRSDCVVNCRIASIVALCNCLIFYLPISQRSGAGGYTGIPTCTLEHVQCLNHYRIKWSTMVMAYDGDVVGLEMEIQDGLFCPDCLPSCSDTIYTVSSEKLPLIPTKRPYKSILSGVNNVSDVALVRVFLGQPDTWLYKQRLSIEWQEIVSNLGGICGVISGFSLILFVEVFYFVTKHIIRQLRKLHHVQSNITEKSQKLHILP